MPEKNSFHVRLKEAREAAGMSQERLAKLAHVSQGHISQLESGKKIPSLGIATAIACALKTRCEEIWVPKRKKRQKSS